MPVEAVALVLGQHADAPDPAVDEIGEGEVDQPVQAAEGHGRLGAVIGERRQTLTGSASENDREYLRLGHPELLSKAGFGTAEVGNYGAPIVLNLRLAHLLALVQTCVARSP